MSNDKWDWVAAWQDNLEELAHPEETFLVPPDFYGSEELRAMGIKCGKNCLLHKTTTIVNPKNLVLGDNVRIDGYSVISCGSEAGGIKIGSFVHVASHVVLMGGAGISVGDYASIASGAKVYSISDDVSGRGMVGPCVPLEDRHLHKGHVVLEAYSVLCVNSVVMPRGSLGEGAVLLPFTVLNEKVPSNIIKDKNTLKDRLRHYK
jgi:galactoside O-acetyltransferase